MSDKYSVADHNMADNLEKLFEANGWNELKMVHPSDSSLSVTITPCFYDYSKVEIGGLKNVDYFLMDSSSVVLNGSENLLDVAKTFNDLPQIVKEDAVEKNKLREFYDNNIFGHTQAQLDLSSAVSSVAYDAWSDSMKNGDHSGFSDYVDNHISDIALSMRLPTAVAKDAFAFSENLSLYSDWSKDLYGHRLRDYGVVFEEKNDKLFGGLRASEYESAFLKEHPEFENKKNNRLLPGNGVFDDDSFEDSDDFSFDI